MFNLVLLGLVSFFTDLSSEMVYPLLPVFLTVTLGASATALGVVEGLAESAASLLKLLSGWLSDRTGRRKATAAGGYGLSALGKALLPLAHGWPTVLAGRLVDRSGKGIRGAPRDALLAESVSADMRGRAFGLHRAMDNAGAVAGTAVAYLLLRSAAVDVRSVMGWAVAPAVVSVLLLLLAVDPRRGPAGRAGELPRLTWAGLGPGLRTVLGAAFVFALGNSSNAFLLLRAGSLGFGAAEQVLLYLVYNVVYVLASYPAGALSDRLGRVRVVGAGYLVHAGVYLGFALSPSREAVWLLFAAYGLFIGMTDGVERALLVDLAPEERKASVLGLQATLVGAALLPASLLAGLLWQRLGPPAPFVWGALTGVAGAALLLRADLRRGWRAAAGPGTRGCRPI